MILDLKKNKDKIKKYILLRNKYSGIILTRRVNISETIKWLEEKDVEVFIDVEKNKLIGASILHSYRKGEITIFVDEKSKKIGTKLLKRLEKSAKTNNLHKVWAWTSIKNPIASIFFIKNGYIPLNFEEKHYKNKKIRGIIYEKILK